MPWRVAVVLIAAAFWSCDSTASRVPVPVPSGPGDGILFIGNSLTSANDLPGIVEGLSAAVGRRLTAATVAYGGYGLVEHWNQKDALRAIATSGWRVVILQQGPSSLQESRAILRQYTRMFDVPIRSAGARTALFSVWPESSRKSVFPDVAASYLLAASDVGGIYLPVTDAWLAAWVANPAQPLYSADGFHPSEEGSYLAALVIAGVLTGASPSIMPARVIRPNGPELAIPPATATLLQTAAVAAIAGAARR
jgi:hypothetical protein